MESALAAYDGRRASALRMPRSKTATVIVINAPRSARWTGVKIRAFTAA
jgi:hypothetical protein